MKKYVLLLISFFMLTGSLAFAEDLKVGMEASGWSFEDADGKFYSMESWAGQVLVVNYVDPDEADLNEHFTDALKKAKDDGRLLHETYRGIGIADCAATWKPNFAIRVIAGRKAKKYKSTILFDYDAFLRNAWSLKKDTANAIILDKARVCRAIIRGRVPDDQVATLIQLVIDLQSE